MFPLNPQFFVDQAKSFASGFFENRVDSTRRPLSTSFPIEKFFTYGSCVPYLSQSIGIARVFYGSVIVGFGLCELINKIATAKFKEQATFYDKVVLLKGGVVPTFLKGFEHISLGLSTQSSFMGAITTIAYEFILRPYLPKSMSEETTVDPECFQKLFERIKKHSLWKAVDGNIAELRKLIFNS